MVGNCPGDSVGAFNCVGGSEFCHTLTHGFDMVTVIKQF